MRGLPMLHRRHLISNQIAREVPFNRDQLLMSLAARWSKTARESCRPQVRSPICSTTKSFHTPLPSYLDVLLTIQSGVK